MRDNDGLDCVTLVWFQTMADDDPIFHSLLKKRGKKSDLRSKNCWIIQKHK